MQDFKLQLLYLILADFNPVRGLERQIRGRLNLIHRIHLPSLFKALIHKERGEVLVKLAIFVTFNIMTPVLYNMPNALVRLEKSYS